MKKQSFTTQFFTFALIITALSTTSFKKADLKKLTLSDQAAFNSSILNVKPVNTFQNHEIFIVKDILEFEQLQGNTNWIPNAQKRFKSGVFKFYSDNTFLFAPTYGVSPYLYPLKGNYHVAGNTISFSAYRQFSTTNGSSTAQIQGEISLNGNYPKISMHWLNTSGLAAVIYNTPYATSSISEYQITASLEYSR